ncbi:aldo/keto reductase [Lysinibacter sp. HNR]|uniref:aldo/keto reductase n=1 Tax=Lysinibacter sp. HNR TaxID=3031408 RepID=UPI002435540B|nr:aldo/keto reductase [Lysinibacter sp. HNR]WGD38145.1 aldo/keto reductase [Lysinibacter sp. HNR]
MTYVADDARYDRMTYNRTGRSGLHLPELSLGHWHNFGNDRPIGTQRAIIRRAFDLGVTHFDLANNYGPPEGSAESNVGQILREDLSRYRDELIISSKAGYHMWPGPYGDFGSRKYVLSSLDQSLSRLGLDYVDIFYHHRPDPETPIEETAGALAHAVNSGKALYVGVSNYDPEQTEAMVQALAVHNIKLLIHQPRYSMFDRHIEGGLFPVLEREGIGAIVFSPLAQGLLTDRYLSGEVPAGSRAATSHFLSPSHINEEYLKRARALNEIARQRGQTLAQLALSWILRQPQVTSVLVGASSVAQLEQNVGALDAPRLTAEELEGIEPFAVHGTGL